MYPIIAIVGRPNVGKSTIFNSLIGKKYSVVSNIAGTTRDRVCKLAKLDGYNVMLVDTGGLEVDSEGDIESNVQKQAKIAIEEADIVLFTVDGRHDLTVEDYHIAEILRHTKKKCILIANKCDNPNIKESCVNMYRLGFNDPCFTSAVHNIGFDELRNRILRYFKKHEIPLDDSDQFIDEKLINVCFLGKPNVGKSSLVNALLGKEKVIVTDQAGTTRDATETELTYKSKKYNLIDTAGVRRRGKIERGLEKYSVLRSFQAVQRSDVCLLVIDWEQGINKQDLNLGGYILNEIRGLIIVVNKTDLMAHKEHDKEEFIKDLRRNFPFLCWAPVIFTSAITKKNSKKILDIADEIKQERKKRITTAKINIFLRKIVIKHAPTFSGKKTKTPPKIYYLVQAGTEPPRFVFVVNEPNKFHFSYKRYLENEIRKEFGFNGTAIEIILRKKRRNEDGGS